MMGRGGRGAGDEAQLVMGGPEGLGRSKVWTFSLISISPFLSA